MYRRVVVLDFARSHPAFDSRDYYGVVLHYTGIQAPIVFHDDASFGDEKEDFLVKTLVSKTAMKTFDEAILPRAPRFDIQRLDLGRMAPILNDLSDKFDTAHLKSPKIRQIYRKLLFSMKDTSRFPLRFPADIRIRRL